MFQFQMKRVLFKMSTQTGRDFWSFSGPSLNPVLETTKFLDN